MLRFGVFPAFEDLSLLETSDPAKSYEINILEARSIGCTNIPGFSYLILWRSDPDREPSPPRTIPSIADRTRLYPLGTQESGGNCL